MLARTQIDMGDLDFQSTGMGARQQPKESDIIGIEISVRAERRILISRRERVALAILKKILSKVLREDLVLRPLHQEAIAKAGAERLEQNL